MMVENSDSFETVPEASNGMAAATSQTQAAGSRPIQGETTTNPTVVTRNFANLTIDNPELQQMTIAANAKIDSLKKWTVNTYKNTKHLCMEHMGKIDKTIDKELDGRINSLRELRKCYTEVLSTVQYFTNFFALANNMQRSMANAFCELSTRETNIAKELNLQSELLGLMAQNNEPLLRNLTLFISSLQTLTGSTIEDTFMTVENHDQARLEFDVSRQELQNARQTPNVTAETIAELEEQCNNRKQKYEQLKEDVRAKLVLLEENRCKVMRREIVALQMALSKNFTECAQAVKRASADLEKMGLAAVGQDSLPSSLAASSGGVHSFLEK